ncbi:MAG: ATP-grasp domain-containing protein [Paludibacter sp.]
MENILITSAGKRVTLVKQFQEELKKVCPNAKVFTTEMNPDMSPAAIVSDGCFCVKSVISAGYISNLLEICINNNIKIIIPTIDTELMTLSANKDLFNSHGIYPIVSELSFIETCRDKRNTGKFLNDKNIRVPNLIDKHNPIFPLFAKPYDGSLSKDLYIVKSLEELTPNILTHPKLIFMEYIDVNEFKEFTVDMYYGKDNFVKGIVPRERVEIRAGEINKGYTRKNYLVEFLKNRLDFLPGVIGCICIQLFYKEINNEVVGIEINPRFGGGYPLSYSANANFPRNIILEYLFGESVEYSETWLDNTLMLRFDSEVIVFNKQ